MIVEGGEGLGDFEVIEELERVTGVLARDEVGFAEGLDGPKGDVPEVSDGGGDESQHL